LTVAYDGTRYAGWQIQKIGLGVQQRLEEALLRVFQEPIVVHSSSRTDAGVHGLGLVAHLDLPPSARPMAPRKLRLALNAHLPDDVRVIAIARAADAFHARFDAHGKQYRYFVWNHPVMNPLLRAFAWHVPKPLDRPAMAAAAGAFVGRHDFRSFAANRGYPCDSTVRELARCELRRRGPLITFVVEGDGFLYRMCRGIVGTLVQIGLGKMAPGEVPDMLARRDRRAAGMSAPPHGLVLWCVRYRHRSTAETAIHPAQCLLP
jgi:tRNA pseudouridine38-40 synthase